MKKSKMCVGAINNLARIRVGVTLREFATALQTRIGVDRSWGHLDINLKHWP
jgi:hypothetical protein